MPTEQVPTSFLLLISERTISWFIHFFPSARRDLQKKQESLRMLLAILPSPLHFCAAMPIRSVDVVTTACVQRQSKRPSAGDKISLRLFPA